ncbi:MAG: ATP-binding protein [Myxococcales bacterium]|nr:ATP-binding protein [Myxococcales bacterium]MDP3506278.1 ATP-binding protein [Myxococcales bacterium]
MKLAFQTAAAVGAGVFAVLCVDLSLTVGREREVIEAEMRANHAWLLDVVERAVAPVLEAEGLAAAQATVPVLTPGALRLGLVSPGLDDRDGWLTTRRALHVRGAHVADLVASEALVLEEAFLEGSVWQRALTLLVMVLVVMLVAWRFSARVVSRRVERLVRQLRDVGAGRAVGPLTVDGPTELATLAREANAMTLELRATRAALEAEHTEHLATLAQLRHVDRLATVGRLAAGLAHELGAPLSVIAIKADRLGEADEATPSARAQALVIRDRVEFIRVLVRRVLNFGRPSQPTRRQVNLVSLGREVVAMLQPLAAKFGVRVEVVAEEEPLEAAVDGHQLEQVLSNLLTNAFLASKPGGRVWLTVGRTARARTPGAPLIPCASVEVRDEGVGMAPEVVEHLFEPFFTTRAVGEGTGLGLSVCWGIVRDHDGWLDVVSAPGKGSTFTMVVPLSHQEVVHEATTPDAATAPPAAHR